MPGTCPHCPYRHEPTVCIVLAQQRAGGPGHVKFCRQCDPADPEHHPGAAEAVRTATEGALRQAEADPVGGIWPAGPESRGARFPAILGAIRACDYLGPLAERPTEAGGGPMYACECATKYYVCGLGKGGPLPGVGPPVVHFGDCYRCLARSLD